ncbi:RcnB family protein [Phaeovulum sp. W22_SRMD_FR3]|uniref:RcnB family protein n=1 Tax=Phaeovulum sp. W22_SRMD_FR3 TaxID=3240274 RepID=UPI003F943FD3
MTLTCTYPLRTALLVIGLAALPLTAAADGHKHKKGGRDSHHAAAGYWGCPPGLAKKSPSCVPPGLARKADRRERHRDDHHRAYYIGERVEDGYYVIRDPRRYGLGYPADGSRYVISNGQLLQVNSDTMKVINLVRAVDAILD